MDKFTNTPGTARDEGSSEEAPIRREVDAPRAEGFIEPDGSVESLDPTEEINHDLIDSLVHQDGQFALLEIDLDPEDETVDPLGRAILATGKIINEESAASHTAICSESGDMSTSALTADEVPLAGKQLQSTAEQAIPELVEELTDMNVAAREVATRASTRGPDSQKRLQDTERQNFRAAVDSCFLWLRRAYRRVEEFGDENPVATQLILGAIFLAAAVWIGS